MALPKRREANPDELAEERHEELMETLAAAVKPDTSIKDAISAQTAAIEKFVGAIGNIKGKKRGRDDEGEGTDISVLTERMDQLSTAMLEGLSEIKVLCAKMCETKPAPATTSTSSSTLRIGLKPKPAIPIGTKWKHTIKRSGGYENLIEEITSERI